MRKTFKKEGRDAEGRMGGGDTEGERKTGATDMEDCVKEAHAHMHSCIQVLNDGSP